MVSNWELVLRLLVAAGLGSLIGAERERLVWAAGLRTHMLVCAGACLFMIVSAFGFADILNTPHVILDPSRIAAQVVSGIGFLGAGSILLRGDVVRGLHRSSCGHGHNSRHLGWHKAGRALVPEARPDVPDCH